MSTKKYIKQIKERLLNFGKSLRGSLEKVDLNKLMKPHVDKLNPYELNPLHTMILLHIVSHNSQQAIEIVDYLLEEKLILNAIIQENVVMRKFIDGEFSSEEQIMMIGKTKALLFNTIDQLLRKKYPNNMPVLYALPIVAMDWEQADELVRETTKI